MLWKAAIKGLKSIEQKLTPAGAPAVIHGYDNDPYPHRVAAHACGMRRLHAVPAAALPGTGIDLETQAVDVMSSNNDTLRSFDAGIAHLEAIGDAAHAPIPRVVPFEKGEAALPFRDSNQDTLEMMVTR